MGEWIKACSADEVSDGGLFSFAHDGKKILLANIKGNLYATDQTCTHAEADLSSGFLSEQGIRCPLHLSVFNMENGMPLNPPAEEALQTYNVKIDENEIYVEV